MVELALPDALRDAARSLYLAELARMRSALGFPAAVSGLVERPQHGGLVLAYVEPIDVMLACAEQSEWAAMSASEILAGKPALDLEPKRTEIEAILARDRSPRLLALEAEAARRSLPFLWDDEAVTVGLGVRSCTWPRGALPDVADVANVEWARLGAVPTALVTGTNGKTTSTRWLGKVAFEAGKHVGVASSDAISVAGEVLAAGDWTGPAAARTVLRRTDVDFAILETARGGILRRGLAVDHADVALITNISDDHVGSYGIDDLAAMTQVKAVIAEAARGAGTVVLNAADPRLAALADAFEGTRVVLFADLDHRADAAHVIARHRAAGGEAVITSGGRLVRLRGDGDGEDDVLETATELGTVATIPLAFGGAARFNVENALGVAAAAGALGLPDDAIRRALVSFLPRDNPRRTELAEKGGVRILLDFGHNPDGVRAVMTLVTELRASAKGRLVVCLGVAGDRKDRELDEIARVLASAKPDRLVLRDLPHYLRGRAPGEVPDVLRRAFVARGIVDDAITIAASEVDSLRVALDGASPSDFVVVLVHLDHEEVAAFLGETATAR